MKEIDPKHFHKLYGANRKRIAYKKSDFLDYTLMTLISAFVVYFSYGPNHLMSKVGIVLCTFMIIEFLLRHGLEFSIPVILKRPQDVLYMIIYKIQNITPMYVFAIGLLLLENYLIFLTPGLPHKVELMHKIAIYLFYIHFILISLYRTVILMAHLRKKELAREILMQTSWKHFISKQPNITLEILHAYFTGILTHMILIAPWYIVIIYFKFSIIFLPVICLVNFITHTKFLKVLNVWFYRDHWLGHNSELEFLYLHGTHHDAIPSGLIAVGENGHLEGFMRHTVGFPSPFYNPIVTFMLYSVDVIGNIDAHQFIPGIFPKTSMEFQKLTHHSLHHFNQVEPYSFGLNIDQPNISDESLIMFKFLPDELKNAIKLDEKLTGYTWHTPKYERYLNLVEKYQNK